MIQIAIVEDDIRDQNSIKECLNEYMKRNQVEIKFTCFQNAIVFLNDYQPIYDMVFLDIQMPYMDGMVAAEELRKKDKNILLCFITNMSGMAIKGYSVDALDFIVKPIVYGNFSVMMTKAISRVKEKVETIVLKTSESRVRVEVMAIRYVEVREHRVIYHTESGDFTIWGTLKEQKEKLPKKSFAFCNNYCIVNLKCVTRYDSTYVYIGDEKLGFSRNKKKAFSEQLVVYYGETI